MALTDKDVRALIVALETMSHILSTIAEGIALTQAQIDQLRTVLATTLPADDVVRH